MWSYLAFIVVFIYIYEALSHCDCPRGPPGAPGIPGIPGIPGHPGYGNEVNVDAPQTCKSGSPNVDPIAFTAFVQDISPKTGTDTPIVFEMVTVNEGNCYNNNTGKFRAPINGLYHFTLSVAHAKGQGLDVALVKDGISEIIISTKNDNGGQQVLGRSVVLKLRKGNEVWASLSGFYSIHVSFMANCFTGYLISPLCRYD